MRITAKRIESWADQQSAQSELPRLIRRLVHGTTKLQAADMPAGEAVNLPGWDGRSLSEDGSAWVPRGAACWEWSCEKRIANKAREDFEKRTAATSSGERAATTFVFVTARRWAGKRTWAAQHGPSSGWKEVRAYDATTIEEWLELAPAVALALADELGDVGPGVETPERYWSTWSASAKPAITADACTHGRAEVRDRLAATIKERIERRTTAPISVRADTAEEASAFACGVILAIPDLSLRSLVVTTREGWRYVDQHASLAVAIAAAPEIADRVPKREGLAVVIPYGASDMAGHFSGASGDSDAGEIKLDRPMRSDFARALQQLGMDEADPIASLRRSGDHGPSIVADAQ